MKKIKKALHNPYYSYTGANDIYGRIYSYSKSKLTPHITFSNTKKCYLGYDPDRRRFIVTPSKSFRMKNRFRLKIGWRKEVYGY